MTDARTGGPTPPGWLPDPTGAAQLRWWNGHDWTDDYAPVPQAAQGAPVPGERPRLPDTTPVYNVWIWLVVAVPFLSIPLIFLFSPGVFEFNPTGSRAEIAHATASILVVSLTVGALSWVLWALTVLFAYLDWRELKRSGVERPFHWAWAFLYAVVYVIGRSVIVHRVARPRGLAPIWWLIGVTVVSLVIAIIWSIGFISSILEYYYNSGYTGALAI
ncbi:DUF2510 domain-containing protein [Diaminobutyricibacter tongyongensis]|uniref:DUF2510 domain-containing protein n=1 Tax=Leifsonia tongyongensis TaxID=1268043 RepID=A0A6L9XW63_9MICO|nr:DUF2510 domain-containing protein [Diaminobutyricibacter tongyongensis]NEN05659.1 DUF2510 domain-containing protein [Diaminobutyricibacter tongyongensis]